MHEGVLHIWKILQVNWHLGFTAFGGPPVHFKIVSNFSDISFDQVAPDGRIVL
jgi:hypothetical protein